MMQTSKSHVRWWMIGVLLAAAALRIFQIDAQGFWFDELFGVYFARADIPTLLKGIALEGTKLPLYYLTLHEIVSLGHYELMVRLFSAAIGLLCIPLIYIVTRRLLDERTARWSTLFLAVNPFHVFFSREGRPYTLLVFGALLAMYAFIWLLKRQERRWWLLLVISHAMLATTNLYGLLIGFVEFMYLATHLKRQYRLLRPWLAAQIVAVVPLAIWYTYAYVARGGQLRLSAGWMPIVGPVDAVYTFWNYTLGDVPPLTIFTAVALLILLGLCGMAVAYLWRERRNTVSLLLLWLLPVPIVLLIGMRRNLYGDRYLFVTLPALLILIAAGVQTIRWTTVRRAVGIILVALMLAGSLRIYTDPFYNREQWRSAAQIIQAAERPGDQIITYNLNAVIALDFYYKGTLPLDYLTDDSQVPHPVNVRDAKRIWLVIGYIRQSSHALTQPDILEADFSNDAVIAPYTLSVSKTVRQVWPMSGVTLVLYDVQTP